MAGAPKPGTGAGTAEGVLKRFMMFAFWTSAEGVRAAARPEPEEAEEPEARMNFGKREHSRGKRNRTGLSRGTNEGTEAVVGSSDGLGGAQRSYGSRGRSRGRGAEGAEEIDDWGGGLGGNEERRRCLKGREEETGEGKEANGSGGSRSDSGGSEAAERRLSSTRRGRRVRVGVAEGRGLGARGRVAMLQKMSGGEGEGCREELKRHSYSLSISRGLAVETLLFVLLADEALEGVLREGW